MKLAFGILIFIWVLCGSIGAWQMDDFDANHWKKIAWGPFTLAKAYKD